MHNYFYDYSCDPNYVNTKVCEKQIKMIKDATKANFHDLFWEIYLWIFLLNIWPVLITGILGKNVTYKFNQQVSKEQQGTPKFHLHLSLIVSI